MSWKPAWKVTGEGDKWCQNGQVFETEAEALASARCRYTVWTLTTDFTALKSKDKVNYEWRGYDVMLPVSMASPVTGLLLAGLITMGGFLGSVSTARADALIPPELAERYVREEHTIRDRIETDPAYRDQMHEKWRLERRAACWNDHQNQTSRDCRAAQDPKLWERKLYEDRLKANCDALASEFPDIISPKNCSLGLDQPIDYDPAYGLPMDWSE